MPRRIEVPSDELVSCACGCGQLIPKWIKYKRGRPVQRSFVHGHNAKQNVKATCSQCGKVFDTPPYKIKKQSHLFCSRSCTNKYKKLRIQVTCVNCGKTLMLPPNRTKNTKLFFCDRACKQAYRTVERTCAACGKPIKIFRSRNHQPRVYCNSKCQHMGLALFHSGQRNALWTGTQKQYRGANWRPMRRKTLDRDNHICRLCGKQTGLAVHHLIPIRFFFTPEEGNTLSNLVTLCRSCHSKTEPRKGQNPLNEQLIRENLILFP